MKIEIRTLALCLTTGAVLCTQCFPTAALFRDFTQERAFFKRHERLREIWGTAAMRRHYVGRRYKNTVLMQRSDRGRLADQHILLAAMFAGRVRHVRLGDLGRLFHQAVFIDIGSAILFQEGAPTVRDLHEDVRIRPHLSALVATDINDADEPGARFIDAYRKSGRILPFPVRAIEKRLLRAEQIDRLVRPHARQSSTPLILRAANSGPDLFYSAREVRRHLRAVIEANPGRNVLYFFNKYVFFKAAGEDGYEIIGEIDEHVAFNHLRRTWRLINWKTRTLATAFRPNENYVRISRPPASR